MLGSGCNEALHSPSSLSGDAASKPERLGDERRSAGRVTKAPPVRNSTTPQLSIANEPPTEITAVHEGSSVFRLIATLVKQDAPASDEPHGHWYACTSNRRPSKTPLTREKTPTP